MLKSVHVPPSSTVVVNHAALYNVILVHRQLSEKWREERKNPRIRPGFEPRTFTIPPTESHACFFFSQGERYTMWQWSMAWTQYGVHVHMQIHSARCVHTLEYMYWTISLISLAGGHGSYMHRCSYNETQLLSTYCTLIIADTFTQPPMSCVADHRCRVTYLLVHPCVLLFVWNLIRCTQTCTASLVDRVSTVKCHACLQHTMVQVTTCRVCAACMVCSISAAVIPTCITV